MKKFILVIGLTGTKASGKGEVANYLKSKGFMYYSLSDIVREETVSKGLKDYTIKQLQDIGNELHKKYGLGILASRILEKIKNKRIKNKNKEKKYVIDGIRNPGEIQVFRKLKNFYLIAVDAPRKQRYKWLLALELEQAIRKHFKSFQKWMHVT